MCRRKFLFVGNTQYDIGGYEVKSPLYGSARPERQLGRSTGKQKGKKQAGLRADEWKEKEVPGERTVQPSRGCKDIKLHLVRAPAAWSSQ